MLGEVSQTRVSGGNQTHDPHANSLARYTLDYQGTQRRLLLCHIFKIINNYIIINTITIFFESKTDIMPKMLIKYRNK